LEPKLTAIRSGTNVDTGTGVVTGIGCVVAVTVTAAIVGTTPFFATISGEIGLAHAFAVNALATEWLFVVTTTRMTSGGAARKSPPVAFALATTINANSLSFGLPAI